MIRYGKGMLLCILGVLLMLNCGVDENPFGLKQNLSSEEIIELQDNPPTKGRVTLNNKEGFIFSLAVKIENVTTGGTGEKTPDIWYGVDFPKELSGYGIHDLGTIGLKSISIVSDKNYYEVTTDFYGNPVTNYYYIESCTVTNTNTYAIITKGGYYAKIKVIGFNENKVTFDWVFQPNGTRYFNE